jgi:hypothetical protein
VTGIGVLREGPLHASIKDWCARPGDRAEVRIERWVIDLVRADGELVEVQTGGFGPLGPKLDALLDGHRMRIVFPVPAERRIVRIDEHGEVLSARRSPLKGTALDVFDRLVSFPSLLAHPNLIVEVLLCREDHVRAPEAVGSVELTAPADAAALLPAALRAGEPFTTRELAAAAGCRMILAQRIAYCLRAMEILEDAGKRGRAPLHRVV